VAHAGWDEHGFCGYRLFGDLAGSTSIWSLLSLAGGGPRLSAGDAQVLDDIATCLAVADPRIWPLKVTRLAAAYGGATQAFSAGSLFFSTSWVGSQPIVDAAHFLGELRAALGARADDPAAVESAVRHRLQQGQHLPGFGVPARPRDERVAGLRRCLERRQRAVGPHWRMLETVAATVLQEKGIPLNIAGASAAAILDLGLEPGMLFAIPIGLLLVPFLANAYEGGQQAPAVLRRLPATVVDYRGVSPRVSPRACGRCG